VEILKSFSQYGQDEFLDTFLFKNFKDGFYVDIGAYDGITFSNTHRFNIFHNWSGINIEPLPAVFKKLKQNRNSDINLNIAITDKKGTQNFIESNEDMLSGLSSGMKSEHIDRINKSEKSKKIYDVKTDLLKNILEDYNVSSINLLSIDVEGNELSVIRSIDFKKIFIDVIIFESNDYSKDNTLKIKKILNKNNFFEFKSGGDTYMINLSSEFNIFKRLSLKFIFKKILLRIFS
jgi:FkbM family methyltransferase